MDRLFGSFLFWIGAVIATIIGAVYLLRPVTLVVAVSTLNQGENAALMNAFARALQRDGAKIRLKVHLTEGSEASARLLEQKKADLAVVRTDVVVPGSVGMIAVLRQDAVFVLGDPLNPPKKSSSEKTGARAKLAKVPVIAYPAFSPATEGLAKAVLGHYGFSEGQYRLQAATLEDLFAGTKSGKIQSVLFSIPSSGRLPRFVSEAFERKSKNGLPLHAIRDANLLAESGQKFDVVTVNRGTFFKDPPFPAEETETLAVNYLLVASRQKDESQIAEVTRLLFSLRSAMVQEEPSAIHITLPTTSDRAARIPIHPGTIAYGEGTVMTFFDRYGDWIYFLAMVGSVVTSAFVALRQRIHERHYPPVTESDLQYLAELVAKAHQVTAPDALIALEAEALAFRTDLLHRLAGNPPSAEKSSAIFLLLSEFSQQITQKRRLLS